MANYRNGALDRRVGVHFPTHDNPNHTQSFYPKEKYCEMLKGLAYENMESVSKTGCRIFKDYFESLSPEQKTKLLNSAKLYKTKSQE